MRRLFVLIVLCNAITVFSQTKLIEHRSHSMRNFLSEFSESNFGMAPESMIRTANLDTVVLLNDTLAIMITSLHCTRRRSENTRLWNAGRDTVKHHVLFSKLKTVKEIKESLKRDYYFQNNIDSTVFIGFDGKPQSNKPKTDEHGRPVKKKEDKKKDEISFLPGTDNDDNNWLLLLPLIVFIAVPLIAFTQLRVQKAEALT